MPHSAPDGPEKRRSWEPSVLRILTVSEASALHSRVGVLIPLCGRPNPQVDASLLRELDGVHRQIREDVIEAAGIEVSSPRRTRPRR